MKGRSSPGLGWKPGSDAYRSQLLWASVSSCVRQWDNILVCVHACLVASVVSDCLQPHDL